MNQDELLDSIIATTNAPRGQVATYLKNICKEAKALDKKTLLERSGDNEYRKPEAKGEKIAGQINHILLQQEYVNWGNDDELAEIQDLSFILTANPEKQDVWQELFERIEKL